VSRTAITTNDVAKPVGPFSVAIRSGDRVYASGQVGTEPATGRLIDGDVAAQTERAFNNVEAVLRAAGKSLDDVVKVNVYLTDMHNFAAMNACTRGGLPRLTRRAPPLRSSRSHSARPSRSR